MLPAGPDMHGGRVNLLHHAKAPTLHSELVIVQSTQLTVQR